MIRKTMVGAIIILLSVITGQLSLNRNLAVGEVKHQVIKSKTSTKSGYEAGVFGKGIIMGRVIEREVAAKSFDGKHGYLTLSNPYFGYSSLGAHTGELSESIKVYKKVENVVDNTAVWSMHTLPGRLRCSISDFNNEATYLVDYLVPDTLSYPDLAKKFNPKEGTVEIWVSRKWAPDKSPFIYPRWFLAYEKYGSNRNRIDVSWSGYGHVMVLSIFDGDGEKLYKTAWGRWHTFLPNEWHHFALSWSDKSIKVYTDGEIFLQEPGMVLDGSWENIVIGNDWNGRCPANCVFDELRISSIQRSDAEIASSASPMNELEVDEHTVLLAHFEDNPDGIAPKK